MISRLIAVGDIHGEIEKLNSLLEKLNLKASDTIVFLGDYIDRGHNSKEVIDRLLKLSKITNCVFLKGNHEDMLLKTRISKSEDDITHWLLSGGVTTYDNYGDYPTIFNLHGNFFENLKPYYLTEKYLFVHAGINPKKSLESQTDDDLFWIRENFINYPHKFKQTVIFGHTPFIKPYCESRKIGIDTGCGKIPNAPLTALICGNTQDFINSD